MYGNGLQAAVGASDFRNEWPRNILLPVPDLYVKRITNDTSYLEPENAPELMKCTDVP